MHGNMCFWDKSEPELAWFKWLSVKQYFHAVESKQIQSNIEFLI